MSMVVFQSRFLGFAVWLDKPDKKSSKKLKFVRGLFQTDNKEEIELLSKTKNVVRLTPVPVTVEEKKEESAKKKESSSSKSNLLLAEEPVVKKDK